MSLEENHFPEKLRFSDLVKAFAENGTDGVDGRMICDYVFDLFFYELAEVKPIFFQIVVMALLFALFGKLLIAKQGYVADMGFLMVYVGIVLLLLQSFTLIGRVVEAGVSRMLSFMTAFVPAYAATLLLSGNSASAGFFYEVTLGIVYVIELVMKVVFLPGVHIYVLLVMMDHLFEESRFSKLAELIGSALRSLLKFGLALVMGLGVVQSILAPAKDRLAQSLSRNSGNSGAWKYCECNRRIIAWLCDYDQEQRRCSGTDPSAYSLYGSALQRALLHRYVSSDCGAA